MKSINYTNRDFDSIKKDILSFLKMSFPDWSNFSNNSSSMILVEALAYLSDVMHYYIDENFKETFLQSAKERKNIIELAKSLGYKYQGKRGSISDIDIFITVPAIDRGGGLIEPDDRYFMTVKKGTIFKSNTEQVQYFELLEDIDFTDAISDNIKVIERIDPNDEDSAATKYAIKMTGKIVNGQRKEETFTIGDFTPFYKITLAEDDVLDIVSVIDSSSNVFYETDYLANDTIFTITENSSATGDERLLVPYIVNLQSVSRRYIKEVDKDNYTSIVFGAGPGDVSDDLLVPSPYQFILSTTAYSGNLIDPNNLMETSMLGVGPHNTDITVTYRYGGGLDSNVPATSINQISELSYDWPTASSLPEYLSVRQSMEVSNPEPAQGGLDELTTNELRYLASGYFASQKRAVTLTDYVSLIYSMPKQFGSAYRVYAEASTGSDASINLYLLCLNSYGQLTSAYTSLKTNIKNFLSQYRMINDTVYINDGTILNIGIECDIVVSKSYNKSEVLGECIKQLKDKYQIANMDFNRPIIISEIYDILHNITGVVSVALVNIKNLTGTSGGRTYSSTTWDIAKYTKNGIIYSDTKSIFEIRYPNQDIIVRAI